MKRKIKVFTFVDRYSIFIDVWVKYYSKLFGSENLSIVYDDKTGFDIYKYLKKNKISDISVIEYNSDSGNFIKSKEMFNNIQQELLLTNDVVIYTDVDEIIFHPNLIDVLENFETDYISTKGFEIIHNIYLESNLTKKNKILNQRSFGMFSEWYDKPLIVRKQLYWEDGKHNINTPSIFIENLFLVHLNKIDIDILSNLNQQNNLLYPNNPNHNSLFGQNLIDHWRHYFYPNLIPIPKVIKNNLSV